MKRWHRGLEIRPPGPPTSGKRRRVLLALLLLAGCATNATQTEKLDLLAAAVATNSLSAQVALASLETATDVKIKEMAKALRDDAQDAVAAAVASGVTGRRLLSEDIEKAAATRAGELAIKRAEADAGFSEWIRVQREALGALGTLLVDIKSTAGTKAKEDVRLRSEANEESDSRQTGTNTAIGALPTTAEVAIMIDKRAIMIDKRFDDLDDRVKVARPEIVAEAVTEAKERDLRDYAETSGILIALVGAFLGYRKHQSGGGK